MRALCFDLDNTLQDLDSAFDTAAARVLGPFGVAQGLNLMGIKAALTETWPSVWTEFMEAKRPEPSLYPEWFARAFRFLDVPVSPAQLSELVSGYHQEFERSLGLYPDVERALARIAEWPKPPVLAILTNGPSERQRRRIRALGLDRVFSHVVTSEDAGVGKPHPQFFWCALNVLKVQPEHAVMVGDTLDTDVAGARAVGMKSIWVNRSVAEAPRKELADAAVGSLDEAVGVLEEWMIAECD